VSAEKMVKEEARGRLSNKWPIAFFSALELLFVAIIPMLILVLAYSLPGDDISIVDDFSQSPIKAVLFFVFHLAAVLAFVLLSPVYSGFVRIFSGISEGKDIDPADIFYFFYDKQRYRNAVRFMTVLIMKGFGVLFLWIVVGVGMSIMSQTDSGASVGLAVGQIFIAVGFIGAFLCMHRFAFSVMLFSYYDYSPENSVLYGARAAKGNTGKLIKITGSFIWWILSTFFVVPFVYVYPYMTCSYFVAVKYILKQFKEQQGATIADPNFKIDLAMDNNQQNKTIPQTSVQPVLKKNVEMNAPQSISVENKPVVKDTSTQVGDETVQADNNEALNTVSEKADDGTVDKE